MKRRSRSWLTISTVSLLPYGGTWKHFRVGWQQKGKKVYSVRLSDLNSDLVYTSEPSPLYLGPLTISDRLSRVRYSVAKSLRSYDYDTVTPLIRAAFGDDFVGETGSGIEEIIAFPGPGRPKRKRRRDADADYKPGITSSSSFQHKSYQHRRSIVADSSDVSGDRKVDPGFAAVNRIWCQAVAQRTKKTMVFVEWAGELPSKSQWIPFSDLTQVTQMQWSMESESLYPLHWSDNYFPVYPLTVVWLFWDTSST